MADIIDISLPPLGESAPDNAEVSFWYVEPGQTVAAGDNLLQMLTDKATFDVPSPHAGTIATLHVDEGDDVGVGQVICSIQTAD